MNPNDPFNDDNPRDWIDWTLSAIALITHAIIS